MFLTNFINNLARFCVTYMLSIARDQMVAQRAIWYTYKRHLNFL